MTDHMSGYNIKVVLRETGLSAETLRAWERRYGLPNPQRTPGGHRLYSQHDIQMLNWLAARQKEGMSISRAVEHWRSLEDSGQDPLLVRASPGRPISAGGVMLDELCQAWINACMDFDEQASEQLLSEALSRYSPEVVCIQILQKGLSLLGRSWYEGNVSVQQEHFASALAMRRLHSMMAAAPAPNRPGRILAACPAGEAHEFGLLLLALLLRRRGWDVVYMGANVPLIQMERALHTADPYLVISLAQTLPSAASLRQMGEFLAVHNVRLAYGGWIFDALPTINNLIPGYYLGGDFAEAAQVVENLWQLKPLIGQALPVPQGYQPALQHYQELHPQIEIFVSTAMREADILPEHLEIVVSALHEHVAAALVLGDLRLVEHSLKWLEGLLLNYGLSEELLKRFLLVYRQAIETRIPAEDQAVFSTLADLFDQN